MSDEVMLKLMTNFLKKTHPVRRIKIDHIPKGSLKSKKSTGFKRVIYINQFQVYQISDLDQRYNAMMELSKILCKVFYVHSDDTIPLLKKHLHIK